MPDYILAQKPLDDTVFLRPLIDGRRNGHAQNKDSGKQKEIAWPWHGIVNPVDIHSLKHGMT